MFDALLDEDATQLAARVRDGEVSARELTQATLDRLEQREPLIQAFCTLTPERALAQAEQIDRRRARGEPLGALAGVPLAVKDLICTAGVRTTSGSAAYADFIPAEDDITVERLLAADAILLGKTTAPEFGYSGVGHNPLFPSPRNPWDVSKRRADRARVPARRWRHGCVRLRSAVMAEDRYVSRRPTAVSMDSRPRWGGCRCGRAAAMSVILAFPAGNRLNISVR